MNFFIPFLSIFSLIFSLHSMNSHPQILEIIPHNNSIFTQGIYYKNGVFYESSGSPYEYLPQTRSVLGITDKNGNFEAKVEKNFKEFFGEGITEFQGKIYWIMWKNKKCFVFDSKTFKKIGEFSYEGEGWGITTDGKQLIMSNGSEFLTMRDENFVEKGKIKIVENNIPVKRLNELEYIGGFVFANVWLTNDIVKINPNTGEVVKRMNFDFLKKHELQENPNAQEMNGIAYDNEKQQTFLTGKMWKNIYRFDIGIFK